jgi:glycopeptide antibiotics resistance protein
MIAIPFAAGSALVVLGWLVFRAVICIRTGQFHWKREAVQLLFLVNLLVIHRMTFHPFEKLNGQVQPLLFDIHTAWPFRMNLIPFVNLTDYDSKRDLLLNIIGNSTMFIPTGIMTPLLYKHLNSFRKVTFTGFAISLAIEIIQLPFAVRCSDVDDLILNTAGCIIGYGIYALAKRRKHVSV